MEKTVAKFHDFSQAEKSDREFCRKLTGHERLNILLEMTKEATKGPIERVPRVARLPGR